MRILLAAIYPYAFLLLYLLIPFDNYVRVLPNILMAILVIAFPLVVKKKDFARLKSLPVAAIFIFVLYLLINSFASGRLAEDFNIIKKVLLAVGLVILYIPVNDEEKINRSIVFSSLAAILFTVYNFVIITHDSGNFAFGDSPQVVESLLIDRMYLGILSTFSILISFKSIQARYHPNNNYHLANIVINVAFMILIVSKVSIAALVILLLIRQFYGARSIWKPIWAVLALGGLIGLFFLPAGAPNYNDTGLSKNEGELSSQPAATPKVIQNSMTYELRAEIWQCGKTIIEDHGFSLTGMGFETTNNKLLSCYGTQIENPQKRARFIEEEYNTHNQFLDFYMSAGFLALVLFLIFIIVSFLWNRKDFFPTALLVLFIIYCSVENVFHRQIGAYYVGFILIALLLGMRSRENTEIK
ncbi:MAG TPA: O-antigen ligase family protein [Aequorivita sp.]|nr:O-antigen ligase family protein [Aequorivita sp.]